MNASKADVKQWIPAIYARLSKEDEKAKSGKNDVSMSIEHQIDILKEFVKGKGWQEPKVYFDDDTTGTNFERENFQRMYAEAQKGHINVIVIKDTTRFGRNNTQSNVYFDKIVEMGVRTIFIQEGIDTIDPKTEQMLPFYFIFSEWHSKSTSEKVKATFKKQADKGKFFSTYTPYGYERCPNDRYKLIVDPYPASVVKRIFEMRLEKLSFGAIVRALNKDGILPPSGYTANKKGGENKRSRINQWSESSVVQILDNLVYCGDIVNNKVGSVSFKNRKKVKQDKEDWIIVKDMHEPLVSREVWQKCADMRTNVGRVRSTKEKQVSPFTSLMKCPDCGYKMQRKSTYYTVRGTGERKVIYGYNCGTYTRTGKTACTTHYISENDLTELVIADIRNKAVGVLKDENAARQRFYALKSQASGTQIKHDKNALRDINKRLAELDKLIQASFEKMVLGGGLAETFTEMARKYEAEKQELTKQAKQLSTSIDKQSQTENDVELFIALIKKYANITELDRTTTAELIDHITVSASAVKPREVVIYYNIIGDI